MTKLCSPKSNLHSLNVSSNNIGMFMQFHIKECLSRILRNKELCYIMALTVVYCLLFYCVSGKEGLIQLVSVVGGKNSLQSLHAHGQTSSLDEPQIAEVYTKLAASLGKYL